ncbi:MAG: DUF6265 family protein [Flavobacterium sp.]|nr:DUF6265 family protein [Flavobacterium sp.]
MKKLALLATLLIVVSCKNQASDEKLNPAQWILGSWEQQTDKGILTETWQRQNDSVFVGSCYFINESDTLHRETILLEQRADSITYSANVKGQNNDKAVPFRLTTANTNSLVFENPAHDYPQKIVYQKSKSNGLLVTISGILHGKKSVEKYNFSKK